MKKLLLFSILSLCTLNLKTQTVTTIAGGGFNGLGDGGPADSAELYNCQGLDLDALGNLFIADANNSRIRKVAAGTGKISTIAGNGVYGFSGDHGPATSAHLSVPWDLDLDGAGNLYLSDAMNNRIRKISASTGFITTIAGVTNPTNSSMGGYNGDSIPASTAMLFQPRGIAVDTLGNIYIADYFNNRVRKITAGTGIITTIAGTGANTYNGDGIPATTAALFGPNGVAVDRHGNVYISENQNNRIRKVTASTGLISTIAGNGSNGYSGDGGPATMAQLVPTAILVDAAGNIYFASNGSGIRKIDALTGIITTIAGSSNTGFSGDGGDPLNARFNGINGLASDLAGDIYIGDAVNNRVRKISGAGVATSVPRNYSAGESVLYPNPFDAYAILSLADEQINSALTITDAQGKTVRNISFSGRTVKIEKGELQAGIYFVSVTSKDGKFLSRKFVIQ